MPLDGYQALADALRVPRLREEATAYACRGVWRDARARRRPGWRELGLLLYGTGAIACTYVFLWLGIEAWKGRLGTSLDRHVHPPFNVLLVIAVIGLVMFPVWYRLARKAIALFRSVRSRRASKRADTVRAPEEEGALA
jgi:putative peptide zinc metalloprotease protein